MESKTPLGKDFTKNVMVTKTNTEVKSTDPSDSTASMPSKGHQKTNLARSFSAIDLPRNNIDSSKQAKIDSDDKMMAIDNSSKKKSVDSAGKKKHFYTPVTIVRGH